ncbi:hypothetical protein ELI30_00855 [Rhizobium leguminosarum]|nr:hypothetical protein ELI40_00825 [Rhizobium leguminosarum]TAV46887.1 hypothetical protein ELI32_00855 [Rhizobium leguminosarum]TAV56467.1 hypothetical protein ELI31_00855 [Rhizobium leguminosarum]TAV67403.1 hypothetical protein ELI30_00855 [Rhizobium leguminosarum]TAY10413.1 hypothetical protein ELH96_00920 [Rhizobium leguminosarum]
MCRVRNGEAAANLFSPRGEGAGRRIRGPHRTPSRKTYSATPAQGPDDGRDDVCTVAWVIGKTGFAGPLIRPPGTFSPRGEEGVETLRHVP